MGRSFSNNRLLDKLIAGEFLPILNSIKNDPELSIEIRIKNQAKIYYKKSLILTLRPIAAPITLSSGYWEGLEKPILNLDAPCLYFDVVKKLVDARKRQNLEFEIQQRIAKDNCNPLSRFLVLDMEYQFEQETVINRTAEKTRFDLVSLDAKHNKIMLIELKQGLGALSNDSGVDDHYRRFQEHIVHPLFQTALKKDVEGILSSKQKLGLFNFDTSEIQRGIDQAEIDYAFVFAAHSEDDLKRYKQQFGAKYKTLYLDAQANNYVLTDAI